MRSSGFVSVLFLAAAHTSAVWVNKTEEGASVLKDNKPLRIFMCITGQSARLETGSKLNKFVKVNYEKGHVIDLVAILDHTETPHFVNNLHVGEEDPKANRISSFEPYTNVLKDIKFHQPDAPEVPERYRDQLMRDHKPGVDPNERAQNHIRQFTAIQRCYDEMRELEFQNGARYDEILRIRDDAYILAPFTLISEMDDKPDILANHCDNWKGLNDKAVLMTRSAADVYFPGFLKEVYLNGPRDTFINNPETLTYSFLTHEGMNLKQSGMDMPVTCLRGSVSDSTGCLHMRTMNCWHDLFKEMNFSVEKDASLPWCEEDIEINYNE
uniref:Uncharacterized protein n=1 Tax=Lotharella globosa TaxID=91324 RepID=A0A7S4DWW7_9EUKA|mmetsp:Transcript_7543/g.13990  ORF Transcript_7543/g.13990 Transcript_7543/m.13990 type:complete len:326 (+) Transcript_7543:97-1074(+)|eukprot:CAMPEP_0167794864 /NCGR_PEP_ID=MMETSP0111_2-20121227/14065_1 /TAXON_ID=91324 /ORGANISM="Lotharella globosa, Strain CCCM811" /LENGTH=325 /DNA_ID=CAMNT_0007688365 /DNA_START=50 /DNA_END=1027 /DNA_ORIENTATION=+